MVQGWHQRVHTVTSLFARFDVLTLSQESTKRRKWTVGISPSHWLRRGFFGATPDLGPFAFLLRRGTPLCFCGTPLRDAEEGEIGPPRGRGPSGGGPRVIAARVPMAGSRSSADDRSRRALS